MEGLLMRECFETCVDQAFFYHPLGALIRLRCQALCQPHAQMQQFESIICYP